MALIKCPECNKEISDKSEICIGCGFPIRTHLQEQKNEEKVVELKQEASSSSLIQNNELKEKAKFTEIYRYTLFGMKQKVHCPRCGSYNCSHYQEQKVVRKENMVTVSKFLCNCCGKIFK